MISRTFLNAAAAILLAAGPAVAGSTTGPQTILGTAGVSDFQSVEFRAGEPAVIRIAGAVRLWVYDQDGQLVASTAMDANTVNWVPSRTSKFQLVVENPGSLPAPYALHIN